MLTFVNIYETSQQTIIAIDVLWKLLSEREPHTNISHKGMPPLAEHVHFVESRPYRHWWLLSNGQDYVGAIYVTKALEIGLFIFKKYRRQGYGSEALSGLLSQMPQTPFLANIAPANKASAKFFQKFGFLPLQHTYQRQALK